MQADQLLEARDLAAHRVHRADQDEVPGRREALEPAQGVSGVRSVARERVAALDLPGGQVGSPSRPEDDSVAGTERTSTIAIPGCAANPSMRPG